MSKISCVTDWAGTGAMISGVAAILAAIATAALVLVGWRGLSTWRSQIGGTRKLEAAQDLLAKIYAAQAVMEFMLAPWVSPEEMARVEKGENETEADYEIRKVYGVASVRYLDHVDTFNQIKALNFIARARLGEGIYNAVKDIVTFPNYIFSAGSRVVREQQGLERLQRQAQIGIHVAGEPYQQAQERYQRAYDIYHGLDEVESLEVQLSRKIKSAEDLLRAEIEGFN
jgi:hypothetical protein